MTNTTRIPGLYVAHMLLGGLVTMCGLFYAHINLYDLLPQLTPEPLFQGWLMSEATGEFWRTPEHTLTLVTLASSAFVMSGAMILALCDRRGVVRTKLPLSPFSVTFMIGLLYGVPDLYQVAMHTHGARQCLILLLPIFIGLASLVAAMLHEEHRVAAHTVAE